MSGSVDVLAVMREASVVLDQDARLDTSENLLRAVDALAELIEAAKLAKREVEMVCRIEGHDLEYGSAVKLGRAASSLHTALARVGGAS